MRSPMSAIIYDGSAMASSPSGVPALKRVVVRPLVEEKLNDCSPLAEDATAGILLQLRLITCPTPDTPPTRYQ